MLGFAVIALGFSSAVEQRRRAPAENSAAGMRRLADEVVEGISGTPNGERTLGLPDAEHGRLTDNSLQARARWRAQEDAWRKRLAAIDRKELEGHPESVIHGLLDELLQTSFENRVCE